MVSPAALSIILTTFAEGSERNRALAVWGAIAGMGGATGLLLGGALVEAISWRWVFFVNVPIGVIVLLVTPRIVPESRSEAAAKGGYDLAGAITITLGALFMIQGAAELVLAFELRPARGWVWVLLSALASIVLSLVIVSGLPGS